VRVALGQSTMPVAVGEELDEYQLLEGLLLPSANNIAAILASYDAGTVAAFVVKMNAAARALHMDHTDYTDPSGFMPTTVSTAADQLRLAKVAMRTPVFARIVGMKSAVLPVAGTVTNYNGLVGKDGFIGIKTGSESKAGGCLAFADRRRVGGHRVMIVGVVLGQDRGGSNPGVVLAAVLGASAGLADSVVAALRLRPVLGAGRAVTEITNAEGDRVVATTKDPVEQLGWGGLRLPVRVTNVRPLRHLAAGQDVATVLLGGRLAAATPVAATASMPRLRLTWRARHLW
jgi:D-alanyl-D-alanine carboxypeptidase (penicillin-binding protein 5/6)